jgi:hypothetical protein
MGGEDDYGSRMCQTDDDERLRRVLMPSLDYGRSYSDGYLVPRSSITCSSTPGMLSADTYRGLILAVQSKAIEVRPSSKRQFL